MDKFWENKKLEELTEIEWELLCDRCGLCCLLKFEKDNGDVVYSNVVCKYFNFSDGSCNEYEKRSILVPECVKLTLKRVKDFKWLPDTCAYRRIFEGRNLPEWHPLIVGNFKLMEEDAMRVKKFAISEKEVNIDAIEDYLLE